MTEIALPLAVLVAALALTLVAGFVVGRISTAPEKGAVLPMLDLSDAAIAHIAYEARRAYERSLGIIRLKTWNNLTSAERAIKAERIKILREGGKAIGSVKNVAHRLELAVLGLVKR